MAQQIVEVAAARVDGKTLSGLIADLLDGCHLLGLDDRDRDSVFRKHSAEFAGLGARVHQECRYPSRDAAR